jgi:hypothetical protein
MSASAAFMGILGITTSFFSHETLVFFGATVDTQTVLIVQMLGALYLGFAFLNWYLRGFAMGGIYNRPVGLGNTLHFAIVSVTLVKAAFALHSITIWMIAAAYVVFAVWFGLVLFSSSPINHSHTD